MVKLHCRAVCRVPHLKVRGLHAPPLCQPPWPAAVRRYRYLLRRGLSGSVISMSPGFLSNFEASERAFYPKGDRQDERCWASTTRPAYTFASGRGRCLSALFVELPGLICPKFGPLSPAGHTSGVRPHVHFSARRHPVFAARPRPRWAPRVQQPANHGRACRRAPHHRTQHHALSAVRTIPAVNTKYSPQQLCPARRIVPARGLRRASPLHELQRETFRLLRIRRCRHLRDHFGPPARVSRQDAGVNDLVRPRWGNDRRELLNQL